MATATNLITGGTASTSNVTSYASASHTPPGNQTLLYFVQASGTVAATPTLTASANSLTFTLVTTSTKNSSADTQYVFVADQATPASPSAMTVTFDCTGDAATGAIISGVAYDITRVGTNAILQTAKVDNVAGGTAPSTTFSSAAQTGNPTIFAFHVNVTTGSTPPTNWTEQVDTNFSTPAQGGGYATRDSGFTGTTITLGSSTNGACSAIAIELDASSASTPISGTDTETLTESSSLAATVPASDSATATDTSAITASASTTDSATVTDTSSVTASLAGTDSATLTESASVTDLGSNPSVVDSATVTDSSSLAAAVTPTDSAALTDASSVAATAAASDSATLSETSAPVASLTGTDAAVMTETSSIVVTVAVLDNLAQAEASTLLANLVGTDGGTFTDTSSLDGAAQPDTAPARATLREGNRATSRDRSRDTAIEYPRATVREVGRATFRER